MSNIKTNNKNGVVSIEGLTLEQYGFIKHALSAYMTYLQSPGASGMKVEVYVLKNVVSINKQLPQSPLSVYF